jgi:hypothetical protein
MRLCSTFLLHDGDADDVINGFLLLILLRLFLNCLLFERGDPRGGTGGGTFDLTIDVRFFNGGSDALGLTGGTGDDDEICTALEVTFWLTFKFDDGECLSPDDDCCCC